MSSSNQKRQEPGRLAFVENLARIDLDRRERTGIPEAVFAQGKSLAQIVAISRALLTERERVLITRFPPEDLEVLTRKLDEEHEIAVYAEGRILVLSANGTQVVPTGGKVAVLSAGTADIPVAEEARVTALEMGCEVLSFYDVGVAGLQRLVEPIEQIKKAGVSAAVVVAGMEGALPTVVKGLVAIPVVGVPTSVSYGYGRGGEAALMTMLNSCSPGLTVCNIDNGFGGGATAALIANQVAAALGQARSR